MFACEEVDDDEYHVPLMLYVKAAELQAFSRSAANPTGELVLTMWTPW